MRGHGCKGAENAPPQNTPARRERQKLKTMDKVNQSAPVVARSEIEIAADREDVWTLLVAIDQWPSWNPDINSVSVRGKVTERSQFRWKAGSMIISSTIQRLDPPSLIAWTGKTLGVKARHVYRLESRQARTVVRTEESWEGVVPRLFRRRMQETLQSSLDSGLQHLRAEVERRAARNKAVTVVFSQEWAAGTDNYESQQ
jgi:uncharacterized protein YndB with AHSA1/START domain